MDHSRPSDQAHRRARRAAASNPFHFRRPHSRRKDPVPKNGGWEAAGWRSAFRAVPLTVLLAVGVGIRSVYGQGKPAPAVPAAGELGQEVQAPAPANPAWSLSLLPRLGLLVPAPNLYEVYKNFAGDGPIEWTSGSLGRAMMVGLALQVEFPRTGLALRGEVTRTVRAWLHATHGVLIPRILWDPPRIKNTFFDIPARLTTTGIQAALPLRLATREFQPFVLLGFSGKWYSFGPPSQENTVGAILPTGGFVPSADLGGGLAVGLRGFSVELQVRDNVNRYWGRTQHDLSLSAAWRQSFPWPRRERPMVPR